MPIGVLNACLLMHLFVSTASYLLSNQDERLYSNYQLGYSNQERSKRSLSAIGNAAMRKILKTATHIYSDGLNHVFLKTGGYAKALRDFNSVNTAAPVKNFALSDSEKKLTKLGKVGDRHLILKEDPNTGSVILTILKRHPRYEHSIIDPNVESIIVYSD